MQILIESNIYITTNVFYQKKIWKNTLFFAVVYFSWYSADKS